MLDIKFYIFYITKMSKVKIEEIIDNDNDKKKTDLEKNVIEDKNINEIGKNIISLNEKWKNYINLYNENNKEFIDMKNKITIIHEKRHDTLKDAYDTLLSLTEFIINNKDNQIKLLNNKGIN